MERNKPSGARWWFGCVSALQLGFFVSACAPRMPHAAALEKPASSSSVVAPVVASLRDRALSNSRAYEWVTSLVDKVGPRLAGSRGEAAAVAWALDLLQNLGFENVHAESVVTPHWERGAERAELVAPYRHQLVVTALGGSEGTAPEGVEGEVVEVGSIEALEALGPDALQGKLVFFNRVMERSQDGSGYRKAVSVRVRGAAAAGRHGALGVVIRSIGTDSNRLAHTGAVRYEEGGPRLPAAALSIPDAELLSRLVQAAMVTKGPPVRLRLSLGARALAPASEGANVLAEVVGRERPREVVLVGAHLDSWDLGTGALDDGAGCSIAIEAARQISLTVPRPRRTVRVVLFANEENGLAGAKAYAATHAQELGQHTLAIEADLGADRIYAARFLGAPTYEPVFTQVIAALLPLGIRIDSAPAHGGADLSPLVHEGVPVIDLQQDATRYFDLHHTANDTLDKVDRVNLDHVVAAYAALIYAAADAPEGFGRIPEALRPALSR